MLGAKALCKRKVFLFLALVLDLLLQQLSCQWMASLPSGSILASGQVGRSPAIGLRGLSSIDPFKEFCQYKHGHLPSESR